MFYPVEIDQNEIKCVKLISLFSEESKIKAFAFETIFSIFVFRIIPKSKRLTSAVK